MLAVFPLQSGFTHAVSAASTTTTTTTVTTTVTASGAGFNSVPFSLGFGPSNLFPLSEGTPVYTVGDTIWAESGYQGSIPLAVTSPKGASTPAKVLVVTLLSPDSITPLYTFSSSDADGTWNVTIGGSQGAIVIPVHFVNPVDHPVSLSGLSYSLSGGSISISGQASLGDSYDQEVCAAGNATSDGVTLTLPSDMHEKGNITLTPGAPLELITAGQVNESFSFWFELYHPYALDSNAANSLVVNDLLAAQSQPVTFVASGRTNSTVNWNLPPRDGRYEFRAFFQNATNVETVQSRILMVNSSSWVSLSDTCATQPVTSQSLDYSASLTNGQSNWPRNVYVMYRTFGVEGVSSFPVKADLSSVEFSAAPWNKPMDDIKVNVSPNPQVLASSQAGSSLFLLTSQFPVTVGYSLDVAGGKALERGNTTVTAPFSSQTSTFKLAKLTIHLLSDMVAPSTLQVIGPGGLNITSSLIGTNQTSTLLLPGGAYTVSASQGGNTQSDQVSLVAGLPSAVTLNFSTFLSFELILVVTAIMAAIANVLIWVLRTRSLSSRMATPRDASKP